MWKFCFISCIDFQWILKVSLDIHRCMFLFWSFIVAHKKRSWEFRKRGYRWFHWLVLVSPMMFCILSNFSTTMMFVRFLGFIILTDTFLVELLMLGWESKLVTMAMHFIVFAPFFLNCKSMWCGGPYVHCFISGCHKFSCHFLRQSGVFW